MKPSMYNILFPIETINRELDFRLFLAVYFADASRRIFIGQHDVLDSIVPYMQGGVYVGKNLFKSEFLSKSYDKNLLKNYIRLKEKGFSVVHFDEEGSIYVGGEIEWQQAWDRRLDIGVLQRDDFVCTWGELPAKHYSAKRPEFASNIRITGHPRFDIYKAKYRAYYKGDVEKIRERYGRYILLNTNLTYANNSLGLKDSFSPRCLYEPSDKTKRINSVRTWAHTSQILVNFVSLIHRISIEYPNIPIIVRPHPTEDWDFYKTVFNGVNNIHVVHSGPVGPWIMGSEVLIHDGCTTAIEAYFSDKPIINYKSVIDSKIDFKIPNQLGIKCSTDGEVLAEVGNILNGKQKIENNMPSEEACSLLFNFKDYAFEPLIKVMEEALATVTATPKSPKIGGLVLKETLRMLEYKARDIIRPLFPDKVISYKTGRYQFYGFDKSLIEKKINMIQNMLHKKVNFTQIGDSLIVIDQ